jgi:hypothetical protein
MGARSINYRYLGDYIWYLDKRRSQQTGEIIGTYVGNVS